MKRCSKCKKTKKESEFYRNSSKYDGLQSWCKDCIRSHGPLNDASISQKDYNSFYKLQGGICAICGRDRKLYVHKLNNSTRGLLCAHCLNTISADTPRAIAYIKRL